MTIDKIRGSIPALITPMSNGSVDEKALAAFVDWQIKQGSNALVPVGTTGESPTLSHEEHMAVVDITIEVAAGRVPVIAGAGSNNTAESIMLTQHAAKAGADAVLIVSPYYNKPMQEGLYQHFKAINDCADIPLIMYNIPGRSIVDISVETMARAFELKNVVGVKDATADLTRPSLQRHAMGEEFLQLSGEDGTALAFNAHGGRGCISVTANVAPALCREFQDACLSGDYTKALQLQDRLMPLHDAIFVEASPGPIKYAVSLLGHCSEETRLPLVAIEESTKTKVKAAMVHAGLLN